MLGWLVLAARAGCAPLDEAAFGELVTASHAAIEVEDLATFDRLSARIRRRTPCLAFVPSPERWATHLVDIAVVGYFRGREWQTPLATALWIAPAIDRGVGPDHEIASWDPGPPPDRLPMPGVDLHVDGLEADGVPITGLHLVQLRDGDGLRSLRSVDRPLPDGWVDGRPPRGPSGSAALLGVVRTTPSAVALDSGVDLGFRTGSRVHVAVQAAAASRWIDGAVRAELPAGPMTFGVGPALLATGSSSVHLWSIAPSAAFGASVGDSVQLGIAVALLPNTRWTTLRFAVSRPVANRLSWQAGALARFAGGTAPEATIGARLGLTFGP